ncbi:hypothetical protein ABTN18_19255, partial [Acinetobacter baumannii]
YYRNGGVRHIVRKEMPFLDRRKYDFIIENQFHLNGLILDRLAVPPDLLQFDVGMILAEDYVFLLRILAACPFSMLQWANPLCEYLVSLDGEN